MLLAIISDIHDNLANLSLCLQWCQTNKIQKIIFCGDTTTLETAAYLAANFSGEIFMVSGNIELYEPERLQEYKNIRYYGATGRVELDSLRIAFCHETEKIKALKAADPALNFIFYGHTHQPALRTDGTTLIANPGNIAGTFYQASFAVLDTANKKLELKILANLSK